MPSTCGRRSTATIMAMANMAATASTAAMVMARAAMDIMVSMASMEPKKAGDIQRNKGDITNAL